MRWRTLHADDICNFYLHVRRRWLDQLCAAQHLTVRLALVSSRYMNSAFTLARHTHRIAMRPVGAGLFTTTTIITVTTSPVRPVVFA